MQSVFFMSWLQGLIFIDLMAWFLSYSVQGGYAVSAVILHCFVLGGLKLGYQESRIERLEDRLDSPVMQRGGRVSDYMEIRSELNDLRSELRKRREMGYDDDIEIKKDSEEYDKK